MVDAITQSKRTKARLREHSDFMLIEVVRSVIALNGQPGVLLACTDGCKCGSRWIGWLPTGELPAEFVRGLPRRW